MKAHACYPLLGAALAVLSVQAQDVEVRAPSAFVSGRTADFTFRVPVRLTSIHPDARVRILCSVSSGSATIGMIGQGRTDVPLDATGSYSGTVVVSVNADAGKDPSAGRSYQCKPWLRDPSGTRYVPPCTEGAWDCPLWQTIRPGGHTVAEGRIP